MMEHRLVGDPALSNNKMMLPVGSPDEVWFRIHIPASVWGSRRLNCRATGEARRAQHDQIATTGRDHFPQS